MYINQNPLKALIIIGIMVSIGQTLIAQNIIAYEYWFDNNVNSSQTKILNNPSNDVSILDSVDISTLSLGLHTFNFRAKAQNGKWNAPVTNFFFKSTVNNNKGVTHYEYWFDSNINQRNLIPLTNSNEIIVLDSLDISNLSVGLHLLNMRFKSESLWNTPTTNYFFKSANNNSAKITHYEYWLNQEFRRRRQIRLNVPTTDLIVMDSVNIDYWRACVRNCGDVRAFLAATKGFANSAIFVWI